MSSKHRVAPMQGIVAIEPHHGFARFFVREGDTVHFQDIPFHPYFALSPFYKHLRFPVQVASRIPLTGAGPFHELLLLQNWQTWVDTREVLQRSGAPSTWYGDHDFQLQALTFFNRRLFIGIDETLRIMSCHIETVWDGPIQRIETLRITNQQGTLITLESLVLEGSEVAILNNVTAHIARENPDVILIAGSMKSPSQWIVARAHALAVSLDWGRNAQKPHRSSSHHRLEVYGRHIIDTSSLLGFTKRFSPMRAEDRQAGSAQNVFYTLLKILQTLPLTPYQLLYRSVPTMLQAMVTGIFLALQQCLPLEPTGGSLDRTPRKTTQGTSGLYQNITCLDLQSFRVAVQDCYTQLPQDETLLSILRPLQESVFSLLATVPSLQTHWGLQALEALLLLFLPPQKRQEIHRLQQVWLDDIRRDLMQAGIPILSESETLLIFGGHEGLAYTTLQRFWQTKLGLDRLIPLHTDYQAYYGCPEAGYYLVTIDGNFEPYSSAVQRYGELFLRELTHMFLEQKLRGGTTQIVLQAVLATLRTRDFPLSWVMRTTRLTISPQQYKQERDQGILRHAAPYELALSSGRGYVAGDSLSYYITGSNKNCVIHEACRLVSDPTQPCPPDLNLAWYSAQLYLVYERLGGEQAFQEELFT